MQEMAVVLMQSIHMCAQMLDSITQAEIKLSEIEAEIREVELFATRVLSQLRDVINQKIKERSLALDYFLAVFRQAAEGYQAEMVGILGECIVRLLQTPIVTQEEARAILNAYSRARQPKTYDDGNVVDGEALPSKKLPRHIIL